MAGGSVDDLHAVSGNLRGFFVDAGGCNGMCGSGFTESSVYVGEGEKLLQ